MAGKLSFSIAINLLTENFKRGTNNVKSGLRAMQMQVLTFAAALGAGGLGLSNFVTRLIDVARETSRVTTALKNVSGGMGQFANNQRFVIDMAKKYGLEVNALTGNFAKFTAASQVSGMSMLDQRKIFESVSRACTAFGMSADASNGVFLALSQMMSKGKISSEELRLQMGERLPVALQAMAKAAGVSVSGLDKLMKQGKLMSKDVLPGFADALNEMIPNVDTDNLETSVNRLKNAFMEFTEGTNIQSAYKGLLDWLAGAVESAANNIKSIITYMAATISVIIVSRLVNKILASIASAELAAKSAARNAAKASGVAFDEIAWRAQKTGASIKMAFSKAVGSLKVLMLTSIPTAILAVIGSIIAGLINMGREAKRIKSIFSDYRAEIEKSSHTPEIIQLETLQKIVNDTNADYEKRKGALNEINRLLGTSYTLDKDKLEVNKSINDKVSERIKLLEAEARSQALIQKKIETENKIKEIKESSDYKIFHKRAAEGGYLEDAKSGKSIGALASYFEEIREYEKTLSDIDGELKKYIGMTVSPTIGPTVTDNTPQEDTVKDSPLQKAEEKYAQSIRELDAKMQIGLISQSEYNNSLDALNKNTLVDVVAMGKAGEGKFKTDLGDKVKSPKYNATQDELEKVEGDYSSAVKLAGDKLSRRMISEEDYRRAIIDAAASAANSAVSINGIADAADGFIDKVKYDAIQKITAPVLGKRDTTFDYKSTDADKVSGELDVWKKYKEELEEVKREHKDLGAKLQAELDKAIQNVPSLEEALKLARVKEDVRQLSKELSGSLYSGIKDVFSGADRVVQSFQNLKDVFSDVDATGWEKIMSIWEALTNTVDSFMSVIQTIENISALTAKLAGAKTAQDSLGGSTAATAVSTVVQIGAQKVATEMDVAASNRKTEAATTEMAAKSTAAYAGIPFAGLALAAGQIAAMTAMIIGVSAKAPKYANGGIVQGGPSSGDKILARVNAGEMILNTGQQATLFNMLNAKSGVGRSGAVTFKIQGRELVGIIKKEEKYKSRI